VWIRLREFEAVASADEVAIRVEASPDIAMSRQRSAFFWRRGDRKVAAEKNAEEKILFFEGMIIWLVFSRL
jgi:hypothetical protein